MAFPKVAKSGMSVPTGPTGILASSKGRGAAKAGGSRAAVAGKPGVQAPRGRKMAMAKGGRMRGGR